MISRSPSSRVAFTCLAFVFPALLPEAMIANKLDALIQSSGIHCHDARNGNS